MTERKIRKVEFDGALGDRLAGRLDLPSGAQPAAHALFAHCFTCSKDIRAATRISAALATLGIGVLRFDFTGLGSSEGEFANTNFSSNVADLVAAADYLRAHHRAPRLLIGHSFGGAAVLAAASRIPEAAAVVTIGAPCDPEHVRHLFASEEEEIQARGKADVCIAGRTFSIQEQFLEDIGGQQMKKKIAELGKALLVFHSPADKIVEIENARRIFDAARHPKSFISLDDADHLLKRPEDGAYVAGVIAAWVSRYLRPKSALGAAATAGQGGNESEETAAGGAGP
ncbi:MAG: alpha/beta hydrolase family protein [Acidobacteriota bacterium]